MTDIYKKAYTEVLEILSYLPEEEYSKIPIEKIVFYKENMDKNHIYKIDPKIDLTKQNISQETNAILVSLFRDYFATERQKKILNDLLNQNQRKLENIKKEKYYSENIFKKENIDKSEIKNEIQLIQCKETFLNKFINFIKRVLKWK